MPERSSSPGPDFAAVYGTAETDPLTPRLAALLWGAAGYLADTYRSPDTWSDVLHQLPPIVARVVDVGWLGRFVSTFDALEDRLAEGGFAPHALAACTAEEMALHLVIGTAEALRELDDGVLIDRLPASGGDSDFESVRQALFRDHDVLVLYDATLDGVERGDSVENQYFGYAHLHPSEWFEPFADA